MRLRTLSLTALLLGGGCAEPDPVPVEPDPPDIRAVTVITGAAVAVAPGALVGTTAFAHGFLTGVAVEPDTGRRLVLTSDGAIRELGSETPLFQAETPDPGFGFTDLVALGGGRVAITTLGDGHLVDLGRGTQTPHFCYEPGWMEPVGQDPRQLASAIAFDAPAGRLYAQPQTLEEGGFGAPLESFVAAYDEDGGQDLTWWVIEDASFAAQGMTRLPDGSLLLGRGSVLQRFVLETGALAPVGDLADLGVRDIAGLAVDAAAGTLLVADSTESAIVELRLSALTLE